MKSKLFLLCLIVTITSISACSDEKDPNMLEVSTSSEDIVGEDYQTVISKLEETGFTNIETKVLDDLITGWLTKDGEIEQVEINETTEFSASDSFQKDSKIVITYHTFKKEEKSDSKATDEKSSETADKSKTDEKSSETADKSTTDEKSSETVDKSTTEEKNSEVVEQSPEDLSSESNQEILTVKNNEDLAALLAVKDTNDLIVSEFSEKYAGRTIEFDGNIAYMVPNGDYKTRYDLLIFAGDYSETTFSGPDFKFEDVNVFDLNLTGSEIPENIGMGQNLHIIAEVEGYKENSGLFFLNPISTEIR